MKNVMIVDDEKLIIEIIEAKLETYKDSLNVITATNGKEAVAALEMITWDNVQIKFNDLPKNKNQEANKKRAYATSYGRGNF